MIGFPDTFLDDVARSARKRAGKPLSLKSVFVKAFYKRPLLLLKVIKVLK
jgi:hypothetical protein